MNMAETVNISLSGPALASLLYENTRTDHDMEGFLSGVVLRNQRKVITDAEQSETRVDYVIKIMGVIPCPKQMYFYNSAGRVNKQKVRSLLGKELPRIVAWYKCRRFSDCKLSFRDKIVHKQLPDVFSSPHELFPVCISTNECSSLRSTHTFSQRFIRYHHCRYVEVPMHIVNLSDSRDTFRKGDVGQDDSFGRIMQSVNRDNQNLSGYEVSTKIQETLQEHIDSLVKDLFEPEKKLYLLYKQIAGVRDARACISKDSTKQELSNSVKKDNSLVQNGETGSVTPKGREQRQQRNRGNKQRKGKCN